MAVFSQAVTLRRIAQSEPNDRISNNGAVGLILRRQQAASAVVRAGLSAGGGVIGCCRWTAPRGRLRSGWRGPGLNPGEPADVVDDVGQADFGFGAGQADGTDDQAEASFLFGKDVLDPGPHLARVALPRRMCAGIGLPRGLAR